MNRNVSAAIKEHHMVKKGDRVLVALSGGADSVALLHVLRLLREELGISLMALHLNHQLRGRESKRDETFVRALCQGWGIPLTVESVPVLKLAKRRGESVELCARKVRYAFFRRHATGKNDKVATAHTRSDNTETVLLNLVRGTGPRGLCGIPPVRGRVIRPLITCTRQEVEHHCEAHALPYVTDSSNLSDDYTRNRLRHHVIPVFEEENPKFSQAVARTGEILRADSSYLESLAAGVLSGMRRPGGLDRAAFLAAPKALRPRVLQMLLREERLSCDYERAALLEAAALRGSGGVQLSPAHYFACEEDLLSLGPPQKKAHRRPPAPSQSIQIDLGSIGETAEFSLIPGKKLYLSTMDVQKYKENKIICEKHLKNALDYDRINKILMFRYARPGDRLRPGGRGCTKTLKNLWAENGTPPDARARTMLLADSAGVLWVEGFGPREAAAVTQDTARVLMVQWLEE